MADALKDALGVLTERREKLAALMDKKDAKTGRLDWSADDHESFKSLNAEVNEKAKEVRELEAFAEIERENRSQLTELKAPHRTAPHGNGRPGTDGASHDGHDLDGGVGVGAARRSVKSVGHMVTDSAEFKGRPRGAPVSFMFDDLDLKTVMTTASGFAPARDRGPDVVPYALRKARLLDIMREVPTGADAVVFMQETTHTAAAAPVAEGAVKPQATYVFTPVTVLVEVIATLLPVTDQQIADVLQLRGLIDGMLAEDVARAEETQILTGTGTSPSLHGFLTESGVQTQAKGSDPSVAAVYKAMTLCRWTGFAEPDAVVFHPNDWQDIRLLQDTTGRFIWGDPWVPGPEMVWGVPVVVTPAMTENTALVGAFRQYAYVARRMGLRIEVGFINDDFARNQKTIKAETRIANVIRRPAAFTKVTGI